MSAELKTCHFLHTGISDDHHAPWKLPLSQHQHNTYHQIYYQYITQDNQLMFLWLLITWPKCLVCNDLCISCILIYFCPVNSSSFAIPPSIGETDERKGDKTTLKSMHNSYHNVNGKNDQFKLVLLAKWSLLWNSNNTLSVIQVERYISHPNK